MIAETEAATQRIEFSHCINRRKPTRALLVAAVAVATIGVLGLLDGPSVSLAARRLLVPWGDEHWPRRHVLQLVDAPTRLAVGQDFEVELIDANGRLPDRVEIHYWFDGDEASQIQTHQMQPLGSKLVHRLANTDAWLSVSGDRRRRSDDALDGADVGRATENRGEGNDTLIRPTTRDSRHGGRRGVFVHWLARA